MENKEKKNINIQWFPGHMKKTTNLIAEKLKLVDFVIVLLDSRVPISSYNPYLVSILKDKKKLFILTKKDLADENENLKWSEKLKEGDNYSLLVDLKDQKSLKEINSIVDKILLEKKEKALKRGIKNVSVRAMVVGIPNVGKSTFINLMAKKSLAIAKNMPGVTKSLRWIKVSQNFELLDTPGVLLPKFENEEQAINLALIGTIKEDILPLESLFIRFINIIKNNYLSEFEKRYEIDDLNSLTVDEIINLIAKKRGLLNSGGNIDKEKTIKIILNEFRNGKIGRITLEKA